MSAPAITARTWAARVPRRCRSSPERHQPVQRSGYGRIAIPSGPATGTFQVDAAPERRAEHAAKDRQEQPRRGARRSDQARSAVLLRQLRRPAGIQRRPGRCAMSRRQRCATGSSSMCAGSRRRVPAAASAGSRTPTDPGRTLRSVPIGDRGARPAGDRSEPCGGEPLQAISPAERPRS